MKFLSPLFFWSFLSLLPLVAVYLLKVRPRRAPTTAFFLWERVFHEKRATSLLRRLRDFWSLLLMCLVFCAICLALTSPQWNSEQRKDLLIVLDNSASMNARDGFSTRLEKACQAARDIVRAMDGTQRAALATLSDQLVYRCHMTDSPQQLLDAIMAVDSTVGSLSDAAMQQAEGGEAWSEAHRVVLISDGGFNKDQLPDHVDWMAVGSQRDNIGLVAADMRYLSFANRQLALYVQLASTFDLVQEVDLTVSYASGGEPAQLMKLMPFDVQPGLNDPQTLTIENAEPGRWTVRLDVDDPLAQDNLAYLAVEPPRPVRVAVETDDRFFFENSVSAFSHQAGLLMLDSQDPQVVIGKSTAPTPTAF